MLSCPILWSRWLNFLFHWRWICLVFQDWGGGLASLQRQCYTVCWRLLQKTPSLLWASTGSNRRHWPQPSFPFIHSSHTSWAAIPMISPDSSHCCKAGPFPSTHDAWEPGSEVMGPAGDQPELSPGSLRLGSALAHSHKYWLQVALTNHCYVCPSWRDPSYACAYLIFFTLWFKTILKAS